MTEFVIFHAYRAAKSRILMTKQYRYPLARYRTAVRPNWNGSNLDAESRIDSMVALT